MVDSLNALEFVGHVHACALKVLFHDLIRECKILKHTLYSLNKSVTTLSLQFLDHGLLGLVTCWLVQKQSPAEAPLIKLFERVFGSAQLKQYQDLINNLDQVLVRDTSLPRNFSKVEVQILSEMLCHKFWTLLVQELWKPLMHCIFQKVGLLWATENFLDKLHWLLSELDKVFNGFALLLS